MQRDEEAGRGNVGEKEGGERGETREVGSSSAFGGVQEGQQSQCTAGECNALCAPRQAIHKSLLLRQSTVRSTALYNYVVTGPGYYTRLRLFLA